MVLVERRQRLPYAPSFARQLWPASGSHVVFYPHTGNPKLLTAFRCRVSTLPRLIVALINPQFAPLTVTTLVRRGLG